MLSIFLGVAYSDSAFVVDVDACYGFCPGVSRFDAPAKREYFLLSAFVHIHFEHSLQDTYL